MVHRNLWEPEGRKDRAQEQIKWKQKMAGKTLRHPAIVGFRRAAWI